MTISSNETLKTKAAQSAAPIVYVCVTCRPVGEPDSPVRPGAILAAATAAAAADTEVEVRPMRCLANCSRGPSAALRCNGSWTYVFGGLDATCAGALSSKARASWPMLTTAFCRGAGGPAPLKRGLIARVPPLDFQEADL